MKKSIIALSLLLAISLYACNKDISDNTAPVATSTPTLPATTATYYGSSNNGIPLVNQKATLGRVLFYEKHLSLNNAVSCASCHKQAHAFADNVNFSRGFENRPTGRNSMAIQNLNTLFNISPDFGSSLFWDGREQSITNLVMRPITNHVEMGIEDPNVFVEKLATLPYYSKIFADAYGDEQISVTRIAESISLFISSINAVNTRFDQYERNIITLSALEEEGHSLFISKYNCTRCHVISSGGYTGRGFFDIGLDAVAKDKGRGAFEGAAMDGAFKTPNLRNVALTAPYMHDGRFATLHDVLEHYSSGINNSANLTSELREANGEPMRMNISAHEKDALVAFLGTLTDYDMITDSKFSDPFTIQ